MPQTIFQLLNQFVPIHCFIKGTGKFPIQKCAIFCKFNEISGIVRRQTVLYAAQAIPDPVTPKA
jgi:hypothetical protein